MLFVLFGEVICLVLLCPQATKEKVKIIMEKPTSTTVTAMSVVLMVAAIFLIALGGYNSIQDGRLSSGVTSGLFFLFLGILLYTLSKMQKSKGK